MSSTASVSIKYTLLLVATWTRQTLSGYLCRLFDSVSTAIRRSCDRIRARSETWAEVVKSSIGIDDVCFIPSIGPQVVTLDSRAATRGRDASVLRYIGATVRHPLATMVFPAKAGIQRHVAWIPAFAGMTTGYQAIYETLE